MTIPSPLPSPQSLLKNSSSSQANRKNSLSAVINKLKSEMTDAMTAPGAEEKKSEYQIKSSGSDGIKITFNKTKSSKGPPKSPKHTGLKPGVNSGPASKKSSQSSKSSSSQKLLYQKSSSSGSLNSLSATVPSPKSSSQPGKSSSKDKLKDGSVSPFSNFSSSSNDMLKNMLNLASPTPRADMKAFDKKFQIPKLSARGKSDDKPSADESQSFAMHPRSAPSTPVQSSTPSPTMDFMRDLGSLGGQFKMTVPAQQFFSNVQHGKNFDDPQKYRKLFKSVSSEQLFGEAREKPSLENTKNSDDFNEADFQAILRAQSQNDQSIRQSSGGQQIPDENAFENDLMKFIGNEI